MTIVRRNRASAAIWLILFAVYCIGITLPAASGKQITQVEAHRLLSVHSLVTDRDLDLNDEYNGGTTPWRAWGGIVGTADNERLKPNVATRPNPDNRKMPLVAPRGGFIEPTPIGTSVALAPAYWIGINSAIGARLAVQIWCAALMALAFAIALRIARMLVPDPWSFWGVLAVGLSPPAVLAATNVGPTSTAAALLSVSVVSVVAVRDDPTFWAVLRTALPCALLPWLWLPLAPVAIGVAAAGARWMRRRRRSFAGYMGLEIILLSAVILIVVNDRLLGGPTPWGSGYSSSFPYGIDNVAELIWRAVSRPVRMLVDPRFSPLIWAPILLMLIAAGWRLASARRQQLARISIRQESAEIIAALLFLVLAAAMLPYAILSPWPQINWLDGPATATALPIAGALVAWSWQRLPRLATGLAALTTVLTVVLLVLGIFIDSAGSTTLLS